MITDLTLYRRRLAGEKAQAWGGTFEDLFDQMCKRHGIVATRFPDGCRDVGHNKLIRVKTPCDWIVSYDGRTALIDTKTSAEMTFPHSKIKAHQILEMKRHEDAGARAGYVIWLRKSNCICFVPSGELERLAKRIGSIQFGQGHVQLLGTPSYFDVRLIFRKEHDDDVGPQDAG